MWAYHTTTLRLLKTGPSAESWSDAISTTPLSFSGGVGVGDAWTVVSGTATMGAEGVGEGAPATAEMGAEEQRHPRPQAPLGNEQGRHQASPTFPCSTPYLR